MAPSLGSARVACRQRQIGEAGHLVGHAAPVLDLCGSLDRRDGEAIGGETIVTAAVLVIGDEILSGRTRGPQHPLHRRAPDARRHPPAGGARRRRRGGLRSSRR